MEVKDLVCPYCEQKLLPASKVSVGGEYFDGEFSYCIPRELDGSPLIRINSLGNGTYVAVEKIQYLLFNNKYVDIYVENKKEPYLVEMSLVQFAKHYSDFIFVRRSILVRKSMIEKSYIHKSSVKPDSYWVRLTNGLSMPVSRRHWKQHFSQKRKGRKPKISAILYGMVAYT